MTNATVGTVSQTTDGGIVHVTYKGGESEYVVGPDVRVLVYVLADITLPRRAKSSRAPFC